MDVSLHASADLGTWCPLFKGHLMIGECDLSSNLRDWHAPLMMATPEEEEGVVTNLLYGRLPSEFDARLLARLAVDGHSDLVARIESQRGVLREYKRAILQYGSAFFPQEVERYTGVRQFAPPPSVHAMVRDQFYAGDFYFCDMIANTLVSTGRTLVDGGHYLDFGASSGRVVRNMQAAYPRVLWQACDPQ